MFSLIMDMFREPNHKKVAIKQLEKAKLDLLEAQSNLEYYTGIEELLKKRVERLTQITTANLDVSVSGNNVSILGLRQTK